MAVVLENSTSLGSVGGVALDFEVGEIANGILLIGIGFRNSSSNFTPSITDNLGSFSLLTSVENTNNVRVEIWQQINPTPGTHSIVVDATTPTAVARGISFALFSGVNLDSAIEAGSITGFGQQASLLVTDQVVDGMVFDVMASMRPTSVTQLNPSISTSILDVAVTGAMVASQATQAGVVSDIGWNLSVAKEWAIATAKLNPYIPTPPALSTNVIRQSLSALLAERLNTVPVFHGRVYEHQPSSLIEYPTCAVISTGFFDDVVDTLHNIRDYQFTIVVWANLGKGKRADGEAIRRRVEDAVFAVLDNYQDFGGNVLWSKPVNAGWGYSVDPAIAYLIINIEARKQRYMSFS